MTQTTDKQVKVSGQGFKPYEVRIGHHLLSRCAPFISPFLKQKRVLIVTDTHVDALHSTTLMDHLSAHGIESQKIVMPAGEASKSFDGLQSLMDQMLALSLDRSDIVIALGGGVMGDLIGFACAIYMRGIDFIQIPTTVLAQVDSSVGGKTAIDHERGKNLIGAFHQPRLVLCDLDVLNTLPKREIMAGFAEVIKYGLLGDRVFFDWLEAHYAQVLALEPEALSHAIHRSVEMKAEIVAQDEREGGVRALLNLGHTFGHALEAECGFGDLLLHGEAVAIGMAQAFRFSALEGLCPQDEADHAVQTLETTGLYTRLSDLGPKRFKATDLITHMGHDKKADGGRLNFVLARAIGDSFVAKNIDKERMLAFLISEGAL